MTVRLNNKQKQAIEQMLIDIQTDSYMLGVAREKHRNDINKESSVRVWVDNQHQSMTAIRTLLGLTSK